MKIMQRIPLTLVRIAAVILMVFVITVAWAQDKGIDIKVDVDGKKGNWYNTPAAYIVGAAVFILLLVALLKNRGGKSA